MPQKKRKERKKNKTVLKPEKDIKRERHKERERERERGSMSNNHRKHHILIRRVKYCYYCQCSRFFVFQISFVSSLLYTSFDYDYLTIKRVYKSTR